MYPLARFANLKRFFISPEAFREAEPAPDRAGLLASQPLHRWYYMLADYLKRKMTKAKDTLPAIAGLAMEVHRRTGMEYRAGIWLEDLHRALLWYIDGQCVRPEQYRAPSWSWASIDVLPDVDWDFDVSIFLDTRYWDLDPAFPSAEVLDCSIDTTDSNPFLGVSAGLIILRGMVMPLSRWLALASTISNPVYYNSPLSTMKSRQYAHWLTSEQTKNYPDVPEHDSQLVCRYDSLPAELERKKQETRKQRGDQQTEASEGAKLTESEITTTDTPKATVGHESAHKCGHRHCHHEWDTAVIEATMMLQVGRFRLLQDESDRETWEQHGN